MEWTELQTACAAACQCRQFPAKNPLFSRESDIRSGLQLAARGELLSSAQLSGIEPRICNGAIHGAGTTRAARIRRFLAAATTFTRPRYGLVAVRGLRTIPAQLRIWVDGAVPAGMAVSRPAVRPGSPACRGSPARRPRRRARPARQPCLGQGPRSARTTRVSFMTRKGTTADRPAGAPGLRPRRERLGPGPRFCGGTDS